MFRKKALLACMVFIQVNASDKGANRIAESLPVRVNPVIASPELRPRAQSVNCTTSKITVGFGESAQTVSSAIVLVRTQSLQEPLLLLSTHVRSDSGLRSATPDSSTDGPDKQCKIKSIRPTGAMFYMDMDMEMPE